MNDKNIVRIKILGAEYMLKTDAEEEYVKQIGEAINTRLAAISLKNQSLPALKVAVLGLVETVDELLKMKQQLNEMESELGDTASVLIQRIEEQLSRNYSIVE
ncbi:MAG: cell division protein ZapA [bacterium]|nr:cell division protein ZapA [bacterium]